MGSDLFDSMEGVSVSFVAGSDSDAVAVSSASGEHGDGHGR